MIVTLYGLIGKKESGVKRSCLHILIQLLSNLSGAYGLINDVAEEHGIKSQISPYSTILQMLSHKSIELKDYSLRFLNQMLEKCPDQAESCKFLAKLENMGVYQECKSISLIPDEDL